MNEMEIARDNAHFFLEQLAEELAAAKSMEEREAVLAQLSAQHRVAGIAALLVAGDLADLAGQLRKSAVTRVELLRLRQNAGAPFDRFSCASQTASLFDAIACGAEDLAQEIARLSATTWLEGEEFEDDFWYAHTVHGLLQGAADVGQRLTSFTASFGDEESPRHAICSAIAARDQEAFDQAFAALLRERRDWVRDKRERVIDNPVGVQIEAGLFVEGLALLLMAERAQLRTEDEYDMIPGIVRRHLGRQGRQR